MNLLKLRSMLEEFYREDLGEGDLSSETLFHSQEGMITLMAKQPGVFCGEDIVRTAYAMFDASIEVDLFVKDGETVGEGQHLGTMKGRMKDLLQGERVILNLIQRMSGIAKETAEAVKAVEGSGARICDTRKTTPGLRMLEKYAVRVGGGYNHRFGLYDAVMLKDNHIAFAGSITKAVETIRSATGHMVKIEVEIETEEQLIEAVASHVDVIMFDNRTPEEIKEWMRHVPAGIITEASGGISREMLKDYAWTGIDYISLGYLTHSVTALDISARVDIRKDEQTHGNS
ncbi:nicotinate-nucleotide pyrophosphorylase (quinolinate phosphoribosyltransferase) [Bacillus sp. 349Y]|nr:nicotinate-nucleotide pyrophosphorylase (quinolinate phosphoribosyltransferase) [Bacillus sp. 349Y]